MKASSNKPLGAPRLLLCASFFSLCLFVMLCSTGAEAFVPIRTPQGSVVRWTQMPVYWFYNHNGFTQMTANEVLAVFFAAFQKWESPACSGLRFKFGGTTTQQWSSQDSRNVLIWNPNIPDPNFPTALALTIPYYRPDGVYLDADIIFNGSYAWSASPSGNQFDALGTATHEIGHFLGLDHTPVTDATMFATANPGLCPCRVLKQDDISGVCGLYPGTGTGTTKRQLGQPCDQTNVCDQDLICLVYQTGAATGVCHKSCPTGACISGEKCFSLNNGDSACACNGDVDCSNGKGCKDYFCNGLTGGGVTKNRKPGETCDATNQCMDGLACVQYQQNTQTGVCHTSCPTGTCATGEKCYTLTNNETACVCQNNTECTGGKLCQNFICIGGGANEGGKEGAACDAQGRCQTGLQCIQDPQNNQSLCVRPCQTDTDCVGGGVCNSQFKVCVPQPPPGTQGKGQPCDPQNTCQTGLTCIVVQEGATTGICLPNCTGGTCAGGEKCIALQGGLQVCACAQNEQCPAGKGCKNYLCETLPNPACTQDSNCPTGQMCQNGQCVSRPGCQDNSQCPPGSYCQTGSCVTVPPPAASCVPACSGGFDCINGTCIFRDECKTDAECNTSEICKQGACHPIDQPDTGTPPIPPTKTGCSTLLAPSSMPGQETLLLLLLFVVLLHRKRR